MDSLLFHLACFGVVNLVIVLLGYHFVRTTRVWQSWMMLVIGIVIIHVLFLDEHPIIRMLALISTTFTAMKVIAAADSYRGKLSSLTPRQWVVFAIGWAGMRPEPFGSLGAKPLAGAEQKIKFGISRLIAGFVLILLAHQLIKQPIHPQVLYPLVTILLLVAFSLILHFGLLSISAGMWRLSGVSTYYLFRAPAKAKTLGEFWSKRWNLAFSEMTSVAIYKPLKGKAGSALALMIAFVFSGLLHELALSVPVDKGFGLPLLYFIIQGLLVLLEKVMLDRKFEIFKIESVGKVWVFICLVAPAPLLFHSSFVKEILWPMAGLKLN